MPEHPSPPARSADAHPWLLRWLAVGLLWHLIGVSATPPPRAAAIYHWSLGVLLFLPALLLAIRERRWLMALWTRHAALLWVLCLLIWACITLGWATGTHVAERAKVPIFVALFLTAWGGWLWTGAERAERLLRYAALGLAVCALLAMLVHPWRHIAWTDRMIGFGMLDGPNLSAYAMGAAALWLIPLPSPDGRWRVLKSLALVVLTLFVLRTGSRGAWAAALAALLLAPIGTRQRAAQALAVAGLLAAVAALWLDPAGLFARGLSYRPQILRQAVDLIAQHPWGGIGLGSHYQIAVGAHHWTHSHNLFTNIAIEIGLPGLLLWLGAWLSVARVAWRQRRQPLAQVVLALWVFSTVALQVDGPTLLHSPRAEWLLTWLPLALTLGLTEATDAADTEAAP